MIEEDPHTVGVNSANWTTRLPADYLATKTGHRTGIETVRVQRCIEALRLQTTAVDLAAQGGGGAAVGKKRLRRLAIRG